MTTLHPTGVTQRTFDPDRVAYAEAAGWRAYYDRDWLRLLWLIIALSGEQFHIPFPQSLLAACHVVRAAAAWAPVDHDTRVVERHYERFYRLAQRYSGLQFDPVEAARLETQYNDVHRRLVGKPDKTEFIDTMIALHSTIFGVTPEQARKSAELRVEANNTVDLITGRISTDIDGDWARIEALLRECYHSLAQAQSAGGG